MPDTNSNKCLSVCGIQEKDPQLIFQPTKQRSCTDILFLLLYIGSWAGLWIVFGEALGKGADYNRIFHGVDYNGTVCGSNAAKGRPYNAWVNMPYVPGACDECFYVKTCLASCAETQTADVMTMFYYSESFLYYCIPTVTANSSVSFTFSGDFQSHSELASRTMADLYSTWPVIVVSVGVALIFCYIYLWLSKRFAGVLVAFTVVMIATGGFLASYALLKNAKDVNDQGELTDRAKAMRGLGIAFAVATGIFILVVIALRKRIYLAIEVVKESARAIEDMPLLPFFPGLPLLFGLCYFVLFITITIWIFSVWKHTYDPLPSYLFSPGMHGKVLKPTDTFYRYSWDESMKNSFAYVFFHLLWSIQFLIYFTYMVIAGAIAHWYFTRRDENGKKLRGNGEGQLADAPIKESCWRTFRYHLGTIALGSLIIAIVQFIRAVVKYIEEKATPPKGQPNMLQRILFCMINCLLWCLECCLDKINKNAFVWTAIYGDSFTVAACSSFRLLWNNLFRVAAINMVGTWVMFVGKLLIALCTTGICGIAIYKIYNNINSNVMPMVVIFLLSYQIAALFMTMFDTTIDTIFLCFLIDEQFHGASTPQFASPQLAEMINKHSGESKAIAEREKELHAKRNNLIDATAHPGAQAGAGAGAEAGANANTQAPAKLT